jgi:rhodanese-related sulfurtransferase
MPYYGRNDPMPPFWGHEEPVPTIDADTAAKAVEAGALIIDLGQPQDWFAGHIKGARLVEPELLDMDLPEIEKEQPLIIASRDNGLTDEVVANLRDKNQFVLTRGGVVQDLIEYFHCSRKLLRLDKTNHQARADLEIG